MGLLSMHTQQGAMGLLIKRCFLGLRLSWGYIKIYFLQVTQRGVGGVSGAGSESVHRGLPPLNDDSIISKRVFKLF